MEEAAADAETQAPAAEVRGDPQGAILVGPQVHEVVAGAHGPQLRGRLLSKPGDLGHVGPRRVLQHGVLDGIRVGAAKAKGDRAGDVVQDGGQIRPNVVHTRVRAHGLDAAGNVAPDRGRRDRLAVGDEPADRHTVADMRVRHDTDLGRRRMRGAARGLSQDTFVGIPPDADPADPVHNPSTPVVDARHTS